VRDALEFAQCEKKTRAETTPSENRSTGQSIQVIARAARVLRALEGEQSGLSLAQIAQRVDLARSTVHE
jgi:hypothetical protein